MLCLLPMRRVCTPCSFAQNSPLPSPVIRWANSRIRYRRRSLPPGLQCIAAPFPGCADPSCCPVDSLDSFIRDGTCPVDGCVVAPRDVLERAEQKLVDSMIVIDLVHLAQATSEPLVVVSADDDLWPGIRFVLLRGARVVHVIPYRGRSVPDRYSHLETAGYVRVVM